MVASATTLASLRTLRAQYCLIGEDAVAAILDSPVFARLDHIDLSANALGDSAREALAARFGSKIKLR